MKPWFHLHSCQKETSIQATLLHLQFLIILAFWVAHCLLLVFCLSRLSPEHNGYLNGIQSFFISHSMHFTCTSLKIYNCIIVNQKFFIYKPRDLKWLTFYASILNGSSSSSILATCSSCEIHAFLKYSIPWPEQNEHGFKNVDSWDRFTSIDVFDLASHNICAIENSHCPNG